MIHKTIGELAEIIHIQNDISAIKNQTITGVSINTLIMEPGNLFIPLKGDNRDGHEFVEQAFEQGASASLWQSNMPDAPKHLPILIVRDTLEAMQELARAYRKELSLKVVAVTGSNGKTTTKDILAELLSLKYKVQKTHGNFNNHIGLPLTILDLKKETEVAVLEMGMNHFGEIDFLTKLASPDAAVITNIGDAHLQDLGSREGIARAKLEILNGLKKGDLFVYPGDEPLIENEMAGKEAQWNIKKFGRSNKNDLYPTELEITENGSRFKVNQSNERFELPILGEYNVLNTLAGMLVANEWGVPFEQMNEAFSKLQLTQMRMEMTPGKNGSFILNDAYNASPTSMKAVLDFISNLTAYSKKIVVLGSMLELGPKEVEFHMEIGKSIDPEKIDMVYTYGELGKSIAKGAEEKFPPSRVLSFTNKNELITHLEKQMTPNTLVLVKASRGMKLEEVVKKLASN